MNKNKIYLCSFVFFVIMIGTLLFRSLLAKPAEKEKFTAEVIDEVEHDATEIKPKKETNDRTGAKRVSTIDWSHTVEVNGTDITLPIRLDSFLEKINGTYKNDNETDNIEEKTDIEDYFWLEIEAEGHLIDVYVQYREDWNNLDSTKYVMGIQQSYNESSANVVLSGNIKKGDSYDMVKSIYGSPDEEMKGSGETVFKYYNPNSKTIKQNEYIIIGFSDESNQVDYVLNYYDGTEEKKE